MISSILFTFTSALFLLGLIFFAGGWLFCILIPRTNPSDIEKSMSEYLSIIGFCVMLIAICVGGLGGLFTLFESLGLV